MTEPEVRESLLKKLIGIKNLEAAKPIEEMDTHLVWFCIEMIIELMGEDCYRITEETVIHYHPNTPPAAVRFR